MGFVKRALDRVTEKTLVNRWWKCKILFEKVNNDKLSYKFGWSP